MSKDGKEGSHSTKRRAGTENRRQRNSRVSGVSLLLLLFPLPLVSHKTRRKFEGGNRRRVCAKQPLNTSEKFRRMVTDLGELPFPLHSR